jgi:hypothetical protein
VTKDIAETRDQTIRYARVLILCQMVSICCVVFGKDFGIPDYVRYVSVLAYGFAFLVLLIDSLRFCNRIKHKYGQVLPG